MNVEGIEWVTDLMGHTGGEQGERIQALALNGLLRAAPALRDITQNHGVSDLLCGNVNLIVVRAPLDDQRHDIKIYDATGRIKNFDVPADRSAALGERFPIQPANAFIEPLADGIITFQ